MTSTHIKIPADALSKLWRAIIEFDMLQPHDRILIGLSGGKDSMLLTAMLAEIKKYSPIPFKLACYTVNGMFAPDFPRQQLRDFADSFGLKHYSDDVDVMAAHAAKGGSPCFTCAYFRRAATNRRALELGFNKVALAHHNDDAVETFFMNVFTSGQLRTFLPVTYLSRTGLTVLRPLLYYREAEIKELVRKIGLTPLKNPCPYDGHTTRQDVKEHIAELDERYPGVYEHLAAAMRQSPRQELWPKKLSQKELQEKFRNFKANDKSK
ncbi:MAG: tRNA 2-thiocytidine biosynthesis TtcA family protein [Acidaminococcaceae bacterium]|nr:tRNA 2-thiocytidine biosynthesis TtcA family protein [Acidaminococcaceae bacterium]